MKLTPDAARVGMFVQEGLLAGTVTEVHKWGVRVNFADGRTRYMLWDSRFVSNAYNLEILPKEARDDGTAASTADADWLANAKTKTVQ